MSEARKILERLIYWQDNPPDLSGKSQPERAAVVEATILAIEPIIQDARAYLERTKEESVVRRQSADALYHTVKRALNKACPGGSYCDVIGINAAKEMDLHLALAGALEIYEKEVSPEEPR